LDYVVTTAGIATTQGYTPTVEGIDQKLAVHYFGRIAFIRELDDRGSAALSEPRSSAGQR